MPLSNQFFGEIRHHPFGCSVVFRRNAFVERRDLSDSHNNLKTPEENYLKSPTQPSQGQCYPARPLVLPYNFVRLLIFAQSQKNRCTQFLVPGPLGEFDFTNEDWI